MEKATKPEVWLRGSLPDVPPLLQPVAHALLQALEEITLMLINFPEDKLWHQPVGMASVGFHLQHMKGVLDRLFTYACALPLTPAQHDYLAAEGKPVNVTTADLLAQLGSQMAVFVDSLNQFDGHVLTEKRGVGRAELPSTVIGLLVHAAEHTMRHTGQLLVTVQVLKGIDS